MSARRAFLGTLFCLSVWTASPIVGSKTHAQQPPAWAPTVYVAKKESSNAPVNTLRESSSATKSTTDASRVARWQTPSQAIKSEDSRSFAETIPVEVKTEPMQNSSRSGVQLASHSEVKENVEPKSSFELNQVLQRSAHNVQPKVSPHRNVAKGISMPMSMDAESAWHDRSNGAKSLLVLGGSEANDSTEETHTKQNPAPSSGRISVQQTRFQEPKIRLPEALSLPPAQNVTPGATENNLLNPPKTAPGAMEADAPLNDLSSRQNRLNTEREQTVPNPFPGPRKPETKSEDSPSDAEAPPRMRPRDDDRAPPPPRTTDRTVLDCDSLRNLARNADIRKVKVDSSPDFVEGIQGTKRTNKNTKEEFVANAPSRNWYDHNGQLVAQGKLVDLEFGLVIIERDDGARASFNMRKLSDFDQAYVAQSWSIPLTCSIDDGEFPSREFSETTMTWKATGACHKPLYFEDAQLERYGHEWGPVAQPVISTLHFFGNVAVLPYKMGIHPMNECQYSLGYYRPGSCAPWTVGPIPLSLRGAAMQAKVVTGVAWALP